MLVVTLELPVIIDIYTICNFKRLHLVKVNNLHNVLSVIIPPPNVNVLVTFVLILSRIHVVHHSYLTYITCNININIMFNEIFTSHISVNNYITCKC